MLESLASRKDYILFLSAVRSACVFGTKVYCKLTYWGHACPRSTYTNNCCCIGTEIVFCIDYVLESFLLKIQLTLY